MAIFTALEDERSISNGDNCVARTAPKYRFGSYRQTFFSQERQSQGLFSLLPPPELDTNDPGWGGLSDLMSIVWPQPAWMVQENILNRNTTMLRGTIILEWDLIPSMIGIRFNSPELTIVPMQQATRNFNSNAAKALFRIWGIRSSVASFTVEDAVRLFDGVRCSDLRDRIFALLCHVPESERLDIIPDYPKA